MRWSQLQPGQCNQSMWTLHIDAYGILVTATWSQSTLFWNSNAIGDYNTLIQCIDSSNRSVFVRCSFPFRCCLLAAYGLRPGLLSLEFYVFDLDLSIKQ